MAAPERFAETSDSFPLHRGRRPYMAHHVESLRCEGSDAIGAKRTCRERRERVDLTKMTPTGQSVVNFAVVHNGHLDVVIYSRRSVGGLGETASYYGP